MDEHNDEYYKQIFYSNENSHCQSDFIIKINFINHFYLIIFCILIITSQANALPISQNNYSSSTVNSNIVKPLPTSTSIALLHRYRFYRYTPIPSYSNNAPVRVHDKTNVNNQELQLRREKHRRVMIEKMFSIFDDDANGQLTKDELYSLSLRLNIFPKFHQFLKKNSSQKE